MHAKPATDEQKKEAAQAEVRRNSCATRSTGDTYIGQEDLQKATRAGERALQDGGRLEQIAADADTDVQAEDQAQRVADAEAAVDRAKSHHSMVDAVVTANAAHATATRYTAAAHALGPRGPRGDMIAAGSEAAPRRG